MGCLRICKDEKKRNNARISEMDVQGFNYAWRKWDAELERTGGKGGICEDLQRGGGGMRKEYLELNIQGRGLVMHEGVMGVMSMGSAVTLSKAHSRSSTVLYCHLKGLENRQSSCNLYWNVSQNYEKSICYEE